MSRTVLFSATLLLGTASLAGAVSFSGAMDNRTGFPLVPGLTAQSRAWVAGGDPGGGVRLEWRADNESNPPFWTYSYRLVRGAARNKGFAYFDLETAADLGPAQIKARQVVSATDPTGATIQAGLASVSIGDPVDFDVPHDFSHAAVSEIDSRTVLSKADLSHYSGDPGRVAPGQAGGNASATASVGPVFHPFRGIRVTFPGSFATLANLGYEASEWEVRLVADRVPMWGNVFAWGDQTTLSPFWYSNFFNDRIDQPARLALGPRDSLTGADPYRGWVLVPGPLPAIAETVPAAAAPAVAATETVTARFVGLMDPASLATAFTLARSGVPVAGSVSWDPTSLTATFTPAAPLLPGTGYTATVSGALDLAGNLMPDLSWGFVTGADLQPPQVTGTNPGDGARFVATGAVIGATFSEQVAAETLNGTGFTLNGPAGPVAGSVSYQAATRSAFFTPAAPLANNARYTATLGTALTDLAGNHLAAPVSWSITTIPSETVFPTVLTTVPAARQVNLSVTTPITAVFSEAMDPATLNSASFTVPGLAGTVSYDEPTRTASFLPAAPLAFSTSYRPTLSTAVKDLAGNPLPLAVTFSFTTAAPDVTAPTVTAVTPFEASGDVPLDAVVSATFSEALNAATVTAASFTLTGQTWASQGSFAVTGTVALAGSGLALPSARFLPDAPLVPGTAYTATLSPAIQDLAGNPLAAAKTWHFTTAPDGVLTPGQSAPTIVDALRLLRIAVGLVQATQDDLNHGDVSPLGPDGAPRPDGLLGVGDALVVLRKVVGAVTF